ncbi:MAG: adenylate kinase family protein [Nitrososphaerota archaeon]|nr:adenylate kinase family protein [Nitrososphaerota archaeon]
MPKRSQAIFGITGTPGTGKKSVAPAVARAMRSPFISLNELAKSEGALRGEVVDTVALRTALAKRPRVPAVVYGHLLPYSIDRSMVSRVAVLRCEPSVLKQRLASRGYPEEKVLDNVRAELIGLVSADALKAFGKKSFEVDTTDSTPAATAAEIVSVAAGKRKGKGPVDWMPNYDSGPKLRSLLPSP